MELLHKNEAKITRLNEFMKLYVKAISNEKKAIIDSYKATIDEISPIDLFYVDMYQQNTSYGIDEIKENADKFVNLFYHALKKHELKSHKHIFFQTLIDENNAIINHLQKMKSMFGSSESIVQNKKEILLGFEACLFIERKFIRMQNIFFPRLETILPSSKPLSVLWTLHDEAKIILNELINLLKNNHFEMSAFKKTMGYYYFLIYGIIQKESLILFPVAALLLNPKTLNSMDEESRQYGYAFIERKLEIKEQKKSSQLQKGTIKFHGGYLNMTQLAQLLNHLPIDITFVDDTDHVIYFNETKHRHFPRNPSIIGRLVDYCHPPKSVHIVRKIIDSFKSKQKDCAEFWIHYKNRLITITYFAVRDENGTYLGVLEVSQDVTDIQKIQGEKRILDWDES